MTPQVADPAVSEAKFAAEIDTFRSLAKEHGERGWFLVEAAFPTATVLMTAPHVRPNPVPVLFGVRFDFTNYDSEPPSVRLINPFTREPYRLGDLPPPVRLNRALPAQNMPLAEGGGNLQVRRAQPLMQGHGEDDLPFLCLAGVREYHDHPGHSGDVWDLHRASGAGTLVRLLDVIHRYGVAPITGFGVNLVPQVRIEYGEPPE